MRIRQVELNPHNQKRLEWLDSMLFPADEPFPKTKGFWWLMEDKEGPVGFAGMVQLNDHTGFLCRAGVFQRFAGKGLHRRLIQVREKKARALGWDTVVTHVSPQNYKSVNNFIRLGYRLVRPLPWFHYEGALHFRKGLVS